MPRGIRRSGTGCWRGWRREAWIVEGVYWKWCRASFERAEQIVFLDTPAWLRHWRLALRFCKRTLGIEKSLKKDGLKGFISLAQWNSTWDENNRGKALEVLAPFESKIIFKK
jgi:hypothetical protein